MRILIVVPDQPEATGNLVTARRHHDGLASQGQEVELAAIGEEGSGLASAMAAFRPDLVYLLHAWRCGRPYLSEVAAPRPPCVVLLTGTDLHHDLDDLERGPVVSSVLAQAAAVITQNPLTFAELSGERRPWGERLRYLPPGIVLGTAPYPLRARHGLPPDTLLFLHPAGLRPVKGNLELLRLFDRLAAQRRGFTVAFCGPALEEAYAREFLAAVAARPWARYLGTIPPAAMAAALREADVVLNHSLSEGLPNALLEAAALGRPILARAIPGNAAVVEHDVNGLLYGDVDAFLRHALALLDAPALHRRLSRPAPERFSAEREARALAAICREARGPG